MKLVKNIQSTAKKVLEEEANAILKIVASIDSSFESCVNHLLKAKGRLVITGIGKSAIIAQKIVATLNSTGTPALFMHAADAIHGDLGMIQTEDTVMCISKSGDTPEIKILIPLIKRTGVKLIAMVSNTSSYLGKNADFILHAYTEKEADILNLAPTTSTTVALALGDALAVCLLECRGFNSDDFAKYHPGGALGKRLYLKVSDIYPNHGLPLVSENASIKEAFLEISSKRLGATAVVNQDNDLLGIITDGDVRRMLNVHDNLVGLTAKDIMTAKPKSINADAFAVEALQLMQEKSITQLVVVENNKPIGFVHLHDLLKEGLV
ncbi:MULTISPECIES: KpsF/GutQ family sugar-phosphate isomerase [Arcicella]|uniref:KpsF/GutQ family sugar-phosphate isomerase n=1 Tax=Arcicella aquatica TaxID=217141 RepID=A0ABU5QT53_9BACT|nr:MULTISPECIES: KpsF/GutQ family sugar-phosphate isomerase [Arcicella]MDR6563397.1 arabinose-5-phosphate isomerase [Arcicella sp. BE51]MDR6813182.1 arabinose-5-phosphate isomerase [Arcicella sp. BE140]MDR6824496.1 arabinose-5-phosphate isomerase [Arcicella sp. BE139]MEA5260293.1 KpsF/GutQ family sugar-phosphate isomerase [Arcicella aquatica]